MAGKKICFYSIPNFKISKNYFDSQLASLKKQGLATLGSGNFSYLGLDHSFSFDKCDNFSPRTRVYAMDFMQFSSGTTGLRKRISYSGEKLLNYIDQFSRVIGVDKKSVIASWVPHYHDEGLIYGILLPLIKGCDMICMSNLDWVMNPQVFLDACRKYKASFLTQPNFAYRFTYDRCRKANLSSIKFYNVGEVVDHEDCRRFEDKFNSKVYGAYALAEAIYAITDSKDSVSQFKGVRNSGKCFGNNQVKIINDEILIRSDHLFKGYETGEESGINSQGWYRTGDHGVIKNGLLYVLGRTDDSFKVNGQKVVPELVEMEINKVKGVKRGRLACIGVENRKGNVEAVLLYEGTISEKGLTKRTANFNITRCVKVPYGWLVKSSSGKISRKYCKRKHIAS